MAESLRFLAEITGRNKRNGAVETFYFADVPFTSKPTDTVPDQYFVTRISQPSDTGRYAFQPGTTRGRSEQARSTLVLQNSDRAFDFLRRYDIRSIVVRCGAQAATTIAEHTTVTSGVPEKAPRFTKHDITFAIRSSYDGLSAALQQNKFGGTNVAPNGIDGSADIAGQELPLWYGTVLQWLLICVNPVKLIYRGRDGGVDFWNATYDNAVALTFGGTYASQAELENDALQPLPGHYKVWLAGGLCRLGSSPTKQPTADMVEGATPADRTHAQIMKRVLLRAGVDLARISAADIAALDKKNPAEISLGIEPSETTEAVCDRIAASYGGWWGEAMTSLIRMVRVEAPVGTPVRTFTEFDIKKDQIFVDPTEDPERGAPLRDLTFEYGQIYTVQTDPAYDGSLTDEQRASRNTFLSRSHRTITSTKPEVAVVYANAAARTIRTLYVHEADARVELYRVHDLRKDERARIRFVAYYTLENKDLDLGALIGIDYPGLDLRIAGYTSGIEFWAFGVRPNAAARGIDFEGWGNRLLDANLSTENDFMLQCEDGRLLIAEAA